MNVSLLAVTLLAISCATHAQQVQLPSDVDLRTAYCFEVVSSNLKKFEAMAEQTGTKAELRAGLADMSSDVQRMRAYLLPKISSLDMTGIMAAKQRGEVDFAQGEADAKACSAKCGGGTAPADAAAADRVFSCLSTCSAQSAAITRVSACRPVNWLPF
jgi:hypothetical protein